MKVDTLKYAATSKATVYKLGEGLFYFSFSHFTDLQSSLFIGLCSVIVAIIAFLSNLWWILLFKEVFLFLIEHCLMCQIWHFIDKRFLSHFDMWNKCLKEELGLKNLQSHFSDPQENFNFLIQSNKKVIRMSEKSRTGQLVSTLSIEGREYQFYDVLTYGEDYYRYIIK